MEQSFTINCANGHKIYKLCTKNGCAHPSGICEQEGCLYERVHNDCNQNSWVDDIVARLINFSKLRSKETDELVIGTINKGIKNLEMLKNEYLQLSGSLEYHTKGNVKQLFSLLKNGPANDVKPQLVNNALEGKNSEKKEDESIERLKQITERVTEQHKEVLKQIRKWILAGQRKIKFLFTEELTDRNLVTILNEGRSVKNIENIHIHNFAVISPSVSDSANQKLIVKLIKKRFYQNFVGMARKGSILQSNFNLTFDYEGIYVIARDGYTYNHSNPKQHGRKHLFSFEQGEVLELQYIESAQSLKITNLTTNQSFSLENINNQEKDLHYCVCTQCQSEEWEILEQE